MKALYRIIVKLGRFFFQRVTNNNQEPKIYPKHLQNLPQFYFQNSQLGNKVSILEKH